MNDATDLNEEFSPADQPPGAERGERNGSAHHANGRSHSPAKYDPRNRREPAAKPVDAWFVLEMVLPRWHWLVVSCLILAFVGWSAGMLKWKRTYTATAQLLRFEPMAGGDFIKPQPLSSDTFANVLKSPELLQQVSTNLHPPLSPELLAKCVLIKNDSESDIVKVLVKAYTPEYAVNLANLYATNAVGFTRELQRQEAEKINRIFIQERVGKMDADITALEKQFRALPQSTLLTAKLGMLGGTVTNLTQQLQANASSLGTARLTEKLAVALDDLASMTRKYTDEHPAVIGQKATIVALENEIAHATNSGAGIGTPGLAANQLFNPDYEIIHTKLNALAQSRQLLTDRQQEAKAFIEDPPGNVRFFAPATIKGITPDHRWLKVGMLTIFGGVLGLWVAFGGIFFVEFADNRLKTADDVQRVTKLPVIASLDNLDQKSPTAREQWAFRTWTMLQGRLSPSPNHGLVCGITSSKAGEGRSTWINLLADAASLSGFRVLTIATRPANGEGSMPREFPDHNPDHKEDDEEPNPNAVALTSNALTCPSEVTQQLTGPNARPSVHIPLPGWVWNLERRKQWQEALKHWRSVENLVILVELPPSSSPEAVLLGENLPNMVWLTDSGKADAAETRQQLETLRHARCNLIGAVLNRQISAPLKSRFPRWLGCIAPALLCLVTLSSQAQVGTLPSAPAFEKPVTNTSSTNLSFSIVSPAQRSEWQNHMTLGAGDLLNISLYGQPELTRPDVLVAPDGRISFLEAQSVMASGLTIDELRTNLEQELGKFRRAPRTIIIPTALRSKRYYMLGRVVQKGVFVMDRPLTVLEAIARAHGFETGLSGRNNLDLADLQRCFLMRGGRRIPLNFEQLLGQGNLAENIPIEPGDYLYFPPTTLREVYVLGEVRIPGPVPYTHGMTIISALSARGGFTDVAYKTHVLVLRGSFSHPQGFVVDTEDILYARGVNFKLEPSDIIFVSGRPFLRAEQLLDLATSAFLESMTAQLTGKLMGAGTQ
jgi:protein involved in polysaccharide export with SLBB domain/capsular polysaccharide biosynthesis protein